MGADDWGIDSEFGEGNDMGGTTELEGFPPPPAWIISLLIVRIINSYKIKLSLLQTLLMENKYNQSFET